MMECSRCGIVTESWAALAAHSEAEHYKVYDLDEDVEAGMPDWDARNDDAALGL